MKLNVYSEIGKLEAVLLHRPGRELENLTPDTLERLLFDDIPYLDIAQKEHDEFAGLLRSKGVKVYYITNLAAEAIENEQAKEEFLTSFINEAVSMNDNIIKSSDAKMLIRTYLESFTDNLELVRKTIEGIRVKDIDGAETVMCSDYPLLADPLPNLYFQRDPFGTIGRGVSINHMLTDTRNRETLYSHIIFKYHEMFGEVKPPLWYERTYTNNIEGGDILVLNKETLLIGISQRTSFDAIEKIAMNLFFDEETTFKTILGINIGQSRKYMHLDTVFTQVDFNKFSVHPEIIHDMIEVFEITKTDDDIQVEKAKLSLKELLTKYTGEQDIELIECGGGDPIAAAREQWNDGANTLAIAPGEVIVYSRNPVTNKLLEENGIKVNVISSAELSRGRGGPRCMSMPLIRKDI